MAEARESEAGGNASPVPALQVIVLGSGGGPQESNVTALLVRSVSSGWKKGSVVAVDAGVHLSAITRILEATQPRYLGYPELGGPPLPHTLATGPFAGLSLPHASASANASYIHRSLIDTYLITHPHLDHISGFVINTAGLPGGRLKKLAGLPSTISAFKTHIFNNVIWPNLTDENNGAGLITYMRLVEGGSTVVGLLGDDYEDADADGRGYLEINDGLAVKVWGVSHGHCIERHSHRGSTSSSSGAAQSGGRHGSMSGQGGLDGVSIMSGGSVSATAMGGMPGSGMSPRLNVTANNSSFSSSLFQHAQQHQQLPQPQTPREFPPQGRSASYFSSHHPYLNPAETACVYDSSAYFMRDIASGREILIFGDVEPDSVSLSPRNQIIWQEAAPKIAAGTLAAILVECSYDDSQPVERLFGHLAPRFLAQEMTNLAGEVKAFKTAQAEERQQNLMLQVQPKSGSMMSGTIPTGSGGGHGAGKLENGLKRRSWGPGGNGWGMGRSLSGDIRKTNSGYASGSDKKRKRDGDDEVGAVGRRREATSQNGDSHDAGGGGAAADAQLVQSSQPPPPPPLPPLPSQLLPPHSHAGPEDAPVSPRTVRPREVKTAAPPALWAVAGTTGGRIAPSALKSPRLSTPTAELSLDSAGSGGSGGVDLDQGCLERYGQLPVAANTTIVPTISMEGVTALYVPEDSQRQQQLDQDPEPPLAMELAGLKVVVIHVKDKLNDGQAQGDVILSELTRHEAELQLGCEYVISEVGQSLYL